MTSSTPHRALVIVLPIAVLGMGVVAFAGLSSLKPDRPEATIQERAAPVVRVAPLTPRDVTLSVIGHGTARVRDTVQLAAEVGGRVAFVASNLHVGSFVAQGQLLVRLDDHDQQIALRTAHADVARAQADLDALLANERHLRRDVELARERVDLADAEYTRQRTLSDSGAGSRNLTDQARTAVVMETTARQAAERALDLWPHDVQRARALLDAAHATLERAQLDLRRLELRAPIPAQVRAEDADLGQVVAPGTPLIALAGHSAYEVAVQLSHADLVKLAQIPPDAVPRTVSAPLGFVGHLPAEVTWVAQPNSRFEAHLSRIETVDPDTRTIPAVVEVAAPWAPLQLGGVPLLPGAYCRVRLPGRTLPNAWVVPEHALREGDRLYVLRQGHLTIVPVRVEHLADGEAVLTPLDPLEPDDQVVLSRLAYPVEGMSLRLGADQ